MARKIGRTAAKGRDAKEDFSGTYKVIDLRDPVGLKRTYTAAGTRTTPGR